MRLQRVGHAMHSGWLPMVLSFQWPLDPSAKWGCILELFPFVTGNFAGTVHFAAQPLAQPVAAGNDASTSILPSQFHI